MLVYADHTTSVESARVVQDTLDRVRALATHASPVHDELVDALIDAGMFESAAADALCPDRDECVPVLDILRRTSEALGLAVAASWLETTEPNHALQSAVDALEQISTDTLPPYLQLRIPEGYAFYALYPEAYVEAALEWIGSFAPRPVVCVGLRSIGSSLSASVHGTLTLFGLQAQSWTLRPRAHPFDRTFDISADLVRRWTPEHATFLLVDEGPGLSGSSLASAAERLSGFGVPDDRIILIAAWHPDPDRLRSIAARGRWRRHRVLTAGFDRVRDRMVTGVGLAPACADLSAGRWRSHLEYPPPWPPCHAQHERIKLLTPDGRLAKFVGLGPFGRQALARAERLAADGWTVRPLGLRRGFLLLPCIAARPFTLRDVDQSLMRHTAAYLAWLRRHESTGSRAHIDHLADMLRVNAGQTCDDAALAAVDRLIERAQRFDEPEVAIDGRLLPHEWLRTAQGPLKTDALDHHRDHFLPGPTDAAWDVAGFIVEAALTDHTREAFVQTYMTASGDATVRERLPFYLASYAAFRLGYCAMADASVDETERMRFAAARVRYANALRMALARH